MNRRQILRYGVMSTGAALASAIVGRATSAQAADGLTIQALGHTCFAFTGGGLRVLSNPFNTLGCTAGYRAPNFAADLVTISSQLLDEGFVTNLPGNPSLLFEPGTFDFKGVQFQGIRTAHDRLGGKRFGNNVVWRWKQGGVSILHLGGIASPLGVEEKILMGRPDVAIIPVGGGPKAYNPEEAKRAIESLQPKIVIPSQYRTSAAGQQCDIEALDPFLNLMSGYDIKTLSGSMTVRPDNLPPKGTLVRVLNYSA